MAVAIENYEASVDTTAKHSGKASARLSSLPLKRRLRYPMKTFKADDHHGKRVRMSRVGMRSEDAASGAASASPRRCERTCWLR